MLYGVHLRKKVIVLFRATGLQDAILNAKEGVFGARNKTITFFLK
jgi:hypothetical protein